jgi:hypothetical protein
MFVITKDFIENYTGEDDEIVEPVECVRIFMQINPIDFQKEVIEPLDKIESAFDEDGHITLTGIKAICKFQFRLYDGDDNLYYEGYYNGLEGSEEEAFEPLDWASYNSGCTTLRYLENGEWVEL